MSSPDERGRRLVLSPRARQDFVSILRHTGETWGEAQMHAYRDKIDAALAHISDRPGAGHPADGLSPSHRLHYVGSHVIVFRDLPPDLAVVRILHQRMSMARHV